MIHPKSIGALAVTGALVFSCATPLTAIADDDTSASAEAASAAYDARSEAPYVIKYAYTNLDHYLSEVGSATVVHYCDNNVWLGNSIMPAQVTDFMGWDSSFMGEEPATRTLGAPADTTGSLTFEQGSACHFTDIAFQLAEDKLTIPAGTDITFKNCSFAHRVVIEQGGHATFENCTFESGTIMNNGTAQYTGTTAEPTNEGQAESTFQSLGLVAAEAELGDAMHNHAYCHDVALNLTGTNAGKATLSVETVGADSCGIDATVENGALHLSGTPTAAGVAKFAITATAPGETDGNESVTAYVSVEVEQEYQLEVEGSFDPIRLTQSFNDTNYRGTLEVFVVDEAGTKTSLNSWSSNDYQFSVTTGSAIPGVDFHTFNAGGTYKITPSGTPEQAGTWTVNTTLSYHGATIEGEAKTLRVYPENVSLADSLSSIEGQPSSWDMEPFELSTSGNAVIPTWLEHVYGSHESGLYGQIGNAEDAYGSDTLTVPAGANVELRNIKINSSVKIVVEAGGTLTLTDCVAYGDIDVNGGTLTVTPGVLSEDGTYEVGNSGITGTIHLNDGATLKNSYVQSNADLLTDGSYSGVPETAVEVNGTVTFAGENAIEGCDGQTALTVNGTALLPKGSDLAVIGGTAELYSKNHGGAAIELAGGTIKGEGSLTAIGGKGIDNDGGTGIAGTGTVQVGKLIAKGGDTQSVIIGDLNGGDAIEAGVTVIAASGSYDIEGGEGSGAGTDGTGAEVVTVKDPATIPGEDPNPGPSDEPAAPANPDDEGDDADAATNNAADATPKTGDAAPAGAAAGLAALAAGIALAARRKLGMER